MVFHTYIPSLPLSRFIDFCWLYQGCDRSFNLEHVLPDGCAELIINLHEDKFRVYNRNLHHVQTFFGSILSGSQSEYVVIDTASQVYVMGVHFKPAACSPSYPSPHPRCTTKSYPWTRFGVRKRMNCVISCLMRIRRRSNSV